MIWHDLLSTWCWMMITWTQQTQLGCYFNVIMSACGLVCLCFCDVTPLSLTLVSLWMIPSAVILKWASLLCDSSCCLHPQPSLRPSPAEVSACLWADSRLVRAIVSAVDGEDASVQLDDLPSSIRYPGLDAELDATKLPAHRVCADVNTWDVLVSTLELSCLCYEAQLVL